MPTIKVLSAGAVQSMVAALGREFERASGNKVDLVFNTAGSLRDRFKNGEAADLVILSESIIAALDKLGLFVPGSIVDLGRTVTGVAVREGAPAPDISTPEAFKQALLKAKSVGLYRSEGGRLRRHHVRRRCCRSSASPTRSTRRPCWASAAPRWRQSIAEGRAEIGTTFISEVLPVQGRQSGRPAAGRAAQRQYLYGGDSGRQRATARRRAGLAARAHRSGHRATRWTAAGLEPAFR